MSKPWRFVVTGGIVAGTFDIVYACLFWAIQTGASPQRVLQGVAAGWLGAASRTGGWPTAAFGVVTHYAIAISMAVAYFLVARRWPALWQRPLAYGAAYGLLLYGIMTHVVVPLSAAPTGGSADPLWIGLTIAVHMLLVGIPCAIFVRRAILTNLRSPVPADAPAVSGARG